MTKVKEPTATYYSKPVFKAKKEKLVERIKKETNAEKIERCLEILGEDSEYDEAYFESLTCDMSLQDAPMPGIVTSEEELDKRIKESEASGIADDVEVNAYFKWMLLGIPCTS